ncbi:hypothetical protein ACFV1W_01980 [Kitasatospora sp. NPDC059648]|uniref:hypothetical protein n=1 Tax=Kitasatospora sp. NPDC059648 TaxID=3346894 RepID=UPI00368B6A82
MAATAARLRRGEESGRRAVPEEQQGEISGLSRSISNLGSSFGTAIAGTILVANLTQHAYAAAMATLALGALIGLATATRIPRSTPTAPTPAGARPRP